MRNKKKFSEIGNILQEKTLSPGETAEVFKLEMPENYIGFLYYLANDSFPMKLNIDGEEMDINEIIAQINSPKLFDPPFLVKNFIKVSATNTTEESKKISFYADGVAYSVLSFSEETLIKEIKAKFTTSPPVELPALVAKVLPIKTEETPPTTADIINHHLNNANQWYEIKLPKNILTWQIRARQDVDLRYSYSPTHATYFSLKSGEVLGADTAPNSDIDAVYVMCETAGVVVELEFWKR